MLGDRYRSAWPVLTGLTAAHVLAAALAAIGGWLVAPMLTPNASALLLAVALMFAGIAAMWRGKAPDPRDRRRLGPFGTSALGGGMLAVGDRTAFIIFALAARGPSPALTALGAAIGAVVLAGLALSGGERGWIRLPLHAISIAAGSMLLATGLVLALGALRLT